MWAAKYGVNDIVDGEYFLMEELKFNLIVFHPYRPLQLYLAGIKHDAPMTSPAHPAHTVEYPSLVEPPPLSLCFCALADGSFRQACDA
jgi:hypothetical protein